MDCCSSPSSSFGRRRTVTRSLRSRSRVRCLPSPPRPCVLGPWGFSGIDELGWVDAHRRCLQRRARASRRGDGGRSEEDAGTFAVESLVVLRPRASLGIQFHRAGSDGVVAMELDLTPFMDRRMLRRLFPVMPVGSSGPRLRRRRTSEDSLSERFLCSGEGRVRPDVLSGRHHHRVARASRHVSSTSGACGVRKRPLVACGPRGWTGPLGTASSLRTWTADGNTVSVAVCHARLAAPTEPSLLCVARLALCPHRATCVARGRARHVAGIVIEACRPAAMVEPGEHALAPAGPWTTRPGNTTPSLNCNLLGDERRLWVSVQVRDGSVFQVLADLVSIPSAGATTADIRALHRRM